MNMQYLIPFCLLLIGLAPAATAQQAGDYVKDPNLEKFEGRWQAENAPYTLTIVFKKEKVHFEKVDISVDLILGWYQLSKNGEILESTLDDIDKGYPRSSFNGNTLKDNARRLNLRFVDMKKRCSYKATFLMNRGDNETGTLKLSDHCGMQPLKGPPISGQTDVPLSSTWKMEKVY